MERDMTIANIEQLAEIIVKEKRLNFNQNELSANTELVESGILERYKHSYQVKNFTVIAPLILGIYKKIKEFDLLSDFKENVDFLKNLINDFNSNGFVPYSRKLTKNLLSELIKESNQLYNCSFVEYIKYLEESQNREDIILFIDSYHSVMGDLSLPIDNYYSNVVKLLELSTSDAELNSPQANILRSVRVKSRNETKFAHNLFSLSLQEEKFNVNIQANIIAALYETEKINFFNNNLRAKLKNGENESAILWGLAFINNLSEADCLLFIEVYKEKHQVTGLSIPSLALLFSIVKTPFKQFFDFCFKEFYKSLEREANSHYLIRELLNLDNFAIEKFDFVKKLIEQEYFNIKVHLDNVRAFLYQIESLDSFQYIHNRLIERFPYTKFAEIFQSTMLSYDTETFDKYLIELLSNNRPELRYAGLDIFEQLSLNIPYRFAYDIRNLPLQTQVNLFLALYHRDGDPNFFLPALLPFLDLEDEDAKESFIKNLENSSTDS